MAELKAPTRSNIAFRAQCRAEAVLHRALAPHAPSPAAHDAHLALATAWDERASASEEYATREPEPTASKVPRQNTPGYHTWGPHVETTPAELRGLSKASARYLAKGCVRCPCGAAKSVDGPLKYKLPGKPWVAVRPACPLSKVPGTDI